MPSRTVLLQAAVIVAWSLFTVWTLMRLGTTRHDRDEDVVYRRGVRGFGVTLWAAAICIGVLIGWQVPSRHSRWYLGALLAFLLLPICLWGGFVWGKIMAGLFPRRR